MQTRNYMQLCPGTARLHCARRTARALLSRTEFPNGQTNEWARRALGEDQSGFVLSGPSLRSMAVFTDEGRMQRASPGEAGPDTRPFPGSTHSSGMRARSSPPRTTHTDP
jgi:hypothetical protein